MFIIILVLIILIYLINYLWLKFRWNWTFEIFQMTKNIPGPESLPIIGNVHPLLFKKSEEIWVILRNTIKEYDYNPYKYWAGNRITINISDPDDVQGVLSNLKDIKKSEIYHILNPWLKEGLLTSGGEKWHQRRRLLTPTFHFSLLKQFIPVFNHHSIKLVNSLSNNCSKELNIIPLITHTSLATVNETLLGIKSIKEEEMKEYKELIYKSGLIMAKRVWVPWHFNDFLFFNFTTPGKILVKMVEKLHQFTQKWIKKRIENWNEQDIIAMTKNDDEDDTNVYNKKHQLAMLDLLIYNMKKGEIDFEGICEEIDTFVFEGHDTTTVGITMALFCLANNSFAQEKIYEELKENGFKNDQDLIDYNKLGRLNYLEKCIKETLRLYPPVPIISRQTERLVKLKRYLLPKNVVCNIHIWDLHRNPKYWKNPDTFDPERFNLENLKDHHQFAYIPFSFGSRNCIGQKFAMLEMKTILSRIILEYILEPVDTPDSLIFLVDLVLRTKNGIRIKLKKRN